MSAVWIGLAISAASAAYGAYNSNKTAKANEKAAGASGDDYDSRIAAAQEGLAQIEKQYNKVREERPDLSWNSYVSELVTSLNDPRLTEAYAKSKNEDFNVLRNLAKTATNDNTENFKATLNSVSGGRADEIISQRNDLVLNNDTKQRFTRAMELRAPEIGAGTVKYDNKGNLIEGQRADKQVFQVAYEVQDQTNKERLANLTQLERDRSSVAQSQQEKALSFMPFYDKTGLAVAGFEANRKERIDFQKLDEMQAFELYKTFAQAASGITPTQPSYQSSAGSDALMAQGIKGLSSGLADYYKTNQTRRSSTAPASTSSGTTSYYNDAAGTEYY